MEQKGQGLGDEGSEYLPQLQAECDSIDTSFTHAKKLMEKGKTSSRVEI